MMKAAMGVAGGGSNSAQSSGRTAVAHSKEFADLIKSIGECRSKQEEDRIMGLEASALKKVFQSPNLDKTKMREYLLRLVYLEMLGNDASFAYIHVVNACSDKNWLMKKIGYLATTVFLNEESEYIIMLVNTIMKDLRDDNYLVVCAALHAVCRLINNDTIEGFMPLVLNLLQHPKELVKKKAVMALHRFIQIRPSLREDLDKHLRTTLCDKDPSVMAATLCVLLEVAKAEPQVYKNLVPSLVSILKQITEHRLPKAYDYHKTPAPFIQVKLLKLLALLGADDHSASEGIYAVLSDVMRRSNTGHTIGNAVVYECVRTITAIYPNPTLLQSAAEMVSTFLRSSYHNLKYIGIDSLGAVVAINPKYAQEQQMAVIDCLEDPDESLKKKTLELLYKMTKPNNVEVIVDRMLSYLGSTSDPHSKAETSKRIGELAERYAPDNMWFIEVMNDVFKMAGDAVDPALGSNIMRIIAEGAGDDDEQADAQLRGNAVRSYLELLELPKISEVLLKVIFWVLGEYGAPFVPGGAQAVISHLVAVLDQQTVSDSAKGYLLSALGKLCCQTRASLTRDAEVFVRGSASSRNADLQQRALEIQALISASQAQQAAALPPDASCEDLEIDPDLPFLNGYVQTALQNGASPYIPEEERDDLGAVREAADRHGRLASGASGLRFEAYETAQPSDPFAASAAMTSVVPTAVPAATAAAAVAAAAPPPAPSGPQLRISGPRKWGPVQYESAQPAPPPPQTAHPQAASGATAQPSTPATSASHEPDIPDEKARLASALFGGVSSGRASTRRGASRAQAPAAAPVPAPAPQMDLLLDLDDTPSQPAAAPAPSAMDLLSELGDILAPPAFQAAQVPGGASLDPLADLMGGVVQQIPLGGMSGMMPSGQAGLVPTMPPVQGMPSMMGMGMGMGAQGGMPSQPSAPVPKPTGPKLGEKPKDDPFSDLLM